MKRYISLGLALIVLLFSLVLAPATVAKAVDLDKYPWRDQLFGRDLVEVKVDGYAYYEEARKILAMVNELRASLGLHPLVYNAQLEQAAMQRAAETSILWSHMRPNGTFIYYSSPYSSENIAAGNITPEKTFRQWVESPSHYEAMVNPNFISIGIGSFGSAKADPPLWWSQVFSSVIGGTEFEPHEAVERYQPTVSLAPEMLKVRPKASEEFALAWEQSFEDGHFAYRMPPGRELLMRPFVHYDVNDEYQVMSLFTPDEWEWFNLNPNVVTLEDGYRAQATGLGEAKVELQLKAFPELKTSYIFKVVQTESYALNASIQPELAHQLEAKVLAESLAKVQAEAKENEVAEPSDLDAEVEDLELRDEQSAETDQDLQRTGEKTEAEPLIEAKWDSGLERYALEIAKHASLCESSNPVQDYPNLQEADHILDLSANYWWIYFSDADQPEDQQVVLPSWAKSYAIVVLESAGQNFTAAVFSDSPPDEQKLYFEPQELRYQVSVYEDKADYDFSIQALEIKDSNLADFTREVERRAKFNNAPAAPPHSLDPLPEFTLGQGFFGAEAETVEPAAAEWPYAFRLQMSSAKGEVRPKVDLDPAFVRYESNNNEVLEIRPDGSFKLHNNGTADLLVSIYDSKHFYSLDNQSPLEQKRFSVKVELAQFEPEPTVESGKQSETEATESPDSPADSQSGKILRYGLPLGLILIALILILVYIKHKNNKAEKN
ncbi:MAG: CAP domain-containing protein [Eubacteriales bacterium]|nr:CAP domain-containing protein [Eubacteriales bacterium]